MKTKIIFISIILISLIFAISCKKDDENYNDANTLKTPYEQALAQLEGGVPDNKIIDINNNGQYDFEIKYVSKITDDEPTSNILLMGYLMPLNDNKIMYQGEWYNKSYLFLKAGDTISNNISEKWSSYETKLLSIGAVLINEFDEGIYEYEWDENWTVLSNLTTEYYLAFKLISESTEEIGWMLLDINTENGEITIIDSEITSEDEIIIE